MRVSIYVIQFLALLFLGVHPSPRFAKSRSEHIMTPVLKPPFDKHRGTAQKCPQGPVNNTAAPDRMIQNMQRRTRRY